MQTEHIEVSQRMQKTLSLDPPLEDFCDAAEVTERLAVNSNSLDRGAIYTRSEIANFILDLVGYDTQAPLLLRRILEPAFGEGDFFINIVERLLSVAKKTPNGLTFQSLSPTIRAFELHRPTYERTRDNVQTVLLEHGITAQLAARLLDVWLVQGDFLLETLDGRFTHIVGNPPYIRHDNIPAPLIREYRKRYSTIYDRADIYVPFIERSLELLTRGGQLGFICSDRWMKNKYGKKLRKFVSSDFCLKVYVDMVDTEAFHSKVSTYPAITVIERSQFDTTRVFARPAIERNTLRALSNELTKQELSTGSKIRQFKNVISGESYA